MAYTVPHIRTVNIDRYMQTLREGGSQPGLVKADDGEMYVIKFRGAAQGVKVLISELIGSEIARALGLNVPEIVFANLELAFGKIESDFELQNQLNASVGLNIGVKYLSGSNTFDPIASPRVNAALASKIVWLDSLINNVDRTAQNTNMLSWNKELWLIDHGASFFFHFNWVKDSKDYAVSPFPRVKNHVLLQHASKLKKIDTECRQSLTDDVIHNIVCQIPDDWLIVEHPFQSKNDYRKGYEQFLLTRIANSGLFVKEAQNERKEAI